MGRIWFARLVAIAGLVLVGTSAMAVAGDGSIGADERQAREIWSRLGLAPEFANNRMTVDVDDGIAVLEGTVDSEQEKELAQQIAHVEGILGVNNRLRVRRAWK